MFKKEYVFQELQNKKVTIPVSSGSIYPGFFKNAEK